MEKAYKFRIYPNKEQEKQIQINFGCCRYVYNHYLAKRKELYETEGKTMSCFECSADLTKLKKDLVWLYDADAKALIYSLRHLDAAYKNFFRRVKHGEKPGYPQFKSKRDPHKNYTTHQNITVFEKHVQLPKLGLVKCVVSNTVEGRILSATVSQSPSGKYFVSLCCTDVDIQKLPETGRSVGIDVGIKSFAVSSDNIEYPNPKYLSKSEKKLAKLQRQLSRKTKDSHNRNKARLKIARLHEHIANQRKDMLHKLTTDLVRQYDVICLEDISPENMMKNHHLAKAIADASWSEFKRQLHYKSEWYDKRVVEIDRFYPSSQTCSCCGTKWEGTKDLKVRKWTCPACRAELDRDINAAVNILNEGLRMIA